MNRSYKCFIEASRGNIIVGRNNQIRCYVRQRKFKKLKENPYVKFEEYEEKQTAIRKLSLKDMKIRDGLPVVLHDSIAKENLKSYQGLRKEGQIPLEKYLGDEPGLADYLEHMKRQELYWSLQQKNQDQGSHFYPGVRRSHLVGVKVGMTQTWDAYGQFLPLTIIHVPRNVVLDHKITPHGTHTLQLGIGHRRPGRVSSAVKGFYRKCPFEFKNDIPQTVYECKVDKEMAIAPGTVLDVRHFTAGQFIDIKAQTKGKGFMGGMKRWGFKGEPASHGISLKHRSNGPIGTGVYPSRVWKGKKMSGQHSKKQRIHQNSYVYLVDPKNSCILVSGTIPGHDGKYVIMSDCSRYLEPNSKESAKYAKDELHIPAPTFYPSENEDLSTVDMADLITKATGLRPGFVQPKEEEEYLKMVSERLNELANRN